MMYDVERETMPREELEALQSDLKKAEEKVRRDIGL